MEQEVYVNSAEALHLVGKELGIPRSHIAVRGRGNLTCLVHKSWLCNLARGIVTEAFTHSGSGYELKLLLQSSHCAPLPPWHRVSIRAVLKQPEKVENPSESDQVYRTSSQEHHYRDNEQLQTIGELLDHISRKNHEHSLEDAIRQYSHNTVLSTSNHCHHSVLEDAVKKAVREVARLSIIHLGQSVSNCPGKGLDRQKKGTNGCLETPSDAASESLNELLYTDHNRLQTSDNFSENVLPLVCAVESETAFFFVEPFLQHSLFDLVMFSPAVLSGSHIRPLFVIYQLLHAVQWYHRNMLTCGHVTLHDVKVYEGLWIFLKRFGVSCLTPCDRHHGTAPNQDTTPVSMPPTSSSKALPAKWDPTQDIQSRDASFRERELAHLVEEWAAGNISNYDYLMALNHYAGRRIGDPNYHPVFPWVADFTEQNGGYRDLTKSKFRLNKGDHQLDMTYKGASQDNDSNAVPHHVSDVLSDITYHVYLARRTPKSVLCDHVRTKWEPNEYPSSMQRLYCWTPDECIPEFFSDPTIFQSIHADLPDLELPLWSGSPEEFIAQQQEMLESEHVSRNLNHWIDLTFGYKLASKASIKAKNVCLHLVDKHQFVTNHGVVQLFTKPHPPRSFGALPLSTRLLSPKIHPHNHLVEDAKTSVAHAHHNAPSLKVAVEDTPLSLGVIGDLSVEETDSVIDHVPGEEIERSDSKVQDAISDGVKDKQQSTDVGEVRTADSMSIILPMDFNPMEYLDKLEAVKSFKSQFRFEETNIFEGISDQLSETESFGTSVQRDLQALGCLIVEMFASDKLRLVSSSLSCDSRVQAIAHLCSSSPKILPRFVKRGVLALLGQNVPTRDGDQGSGLPPLTPGLLLHPQAGLFPFPSYFEQLHSFLGRFYREGLIFSTESEVSGEDAKNPAPKVLPSLLKMEYCFQDRDKSGYTMGQVDFAVHELPSLIPELDEEGLQLLFYHLEPLFKCPMVQLYTFTQLFDLLSQAYGPKVTSKIFMKPLVKLFDSHLMANYEHILTQSFLSKLIVRFRLEQFLSHFINFVVDAVAFKSLGTKDSKIDRRMSGFGLERSTENQDALDMELKSSQYNMSQDQTASLQKVQSRESLEEQESASPFSVPVDRLPGDELNVRVFPNMLGDDETDRPQRLLADKEEEEEEDRDPWKVWSVEKEGKEVDGDHEEEEIKIKERLTIFLEEDQHEKDEDGNRKEKVHTSSEKAFEVGNENANEDISTEMLGKQQVDPQDETERSQQSESNNEPPSDSTVSPTEKESENLVDASPSEGQSSKAVGHDEEPDDEDEDEDSCVSEGDERVQNSEKLPIFPEYPNQTLEDTPKGFASGQDTVKCGSPFPESTIDLVSTSLKDKCEKTREALSPGVVSGLAAESVIWLAPRLGPVLTSRYLASRLLHMLSRCYMGRVGVDNEQEEEGEVEVDDRNARWVLFCLGNFCTLYGEAFMIYQYLPFVEKVIKAIHSSVSARNEAAVAGVLALLKYCLPYMSKDSLMEHFDTFSHGVFQPLLRILASSNLKFPGGGSARTALCHSYVDLLTALSQKLERELAREFMTPLVQQFFSCFELVHMKKKMYKLGESSFTAVTSIERSISTEDKSMESEDKETKSHSDSTGDENEIKGPTGPEEMEAFYKTSYYQELYQTFSAAMAHNAFVPLCGIMGSKYIEGALYNHDLIWNLCCKYDPHLSHPTMEPGTDTDTGDNGNNDTGKQQVETQAEDVFQTQTQEASLGSEPPTKGLGDKSKEMGVNGGMEDKNRSGTSRTPSRRFRGRKRYRKQSSERQETKEKEEKWNSSASDQYLRGTWLEHWQNQLELKGRSRKFSLKEVKLQTFTGW